MNIPIINDEEIVEGLIASLFFPITIILFKKLDPKSFILYSMLAWFTTWVARKSGIHIYKELKNKYHIKNNLYKIYL